MDIREQDVTGTHSRVRSASSHIWPGPDLADLTLLRFLCRLHFLCRSDIPPLAFIIILKCAIHGFHEGQAAELLEPGAIGARAWQGVEDTRQSCVVLSRSCILTFPRAAALTDYEIRDVNDGISNHASLGDSDH